ncbi:uncharacterized protein BDZ99DRAFT_456932 [Mytilinidion resinicola]|uniref:Uncharacterized protein n=1 Tax=Mytilinidion resinicola TaxID=574789 RepID=A0A6A6ZA52_9PEZI|nr:uncharacterized protein BDZ99DRAFT_456932 [Mytilinidion resinicola]KAF2817164.1 hypothetical protein BDZ99DRAFT_456932 [Mytilinidion resinicola]
MISVLILFTIPPFPTYLGLLTSSTSNTPYTHRPKHRHPAEATTAPSPTPPALAQPLRSKLPP